jgi:hypothetical protein
MVDTEMPKSWELTTPITLIIFNRPEKTRNILEAIRKAKPQKLLVIADGPRLDRPGETERCEKTRALIDTVDWNCEVLKNFSDINLGCRDRIETGLSWVFDLCEESIILEDDCLPHPSFFHFSQALLQKYRYEDRVLAICGTNHLTQWKPKRHSYFYSNHFSPWGWASWQRVWQMYDVDMTLWKDSKERDKVKENLKNPKRFKMYEKSFNETHEKRNNAWDYQMLFLGLRSSMVSIVPSRNLISNVGFDQESTNTNTKTDIRANLPVYAMDFPMSHPQDIVVDYEYENLRFFRLSDRSFPAKVARKLYLFRKYILKVVLKK